VKVANPPTPPGQDSSSDGLSRLQNQSNYYYYCLAPCLTVSNTIGPGGLSGCFRCGFVWKPRRPDAQRCPRCKSRLWDAPTLSPVRRGTGLGVAEIVAPKREELEGILRRNKARNPRVFGSVARNEATRKSDLDLLVDFDQGASAFDQMGLMLDLEKLFRRKVDVAEPSGLHWLIRPQVLFEAVGV
jgi:uncharacterized protein